MSNSLDKSTMRSKNLDLAQNLATSLLQEFALSQDFDAKMSLAFGEGIDTTQLRADWSLGKVNFPDIEIRSTAELGGALGAFAGVTGKIYIAQEALASSSLNEIVAILLEEFGHFVDTRLNVTDTPGDEGALFAALVQGKTLSENEIQQIKSENDWTTLKIDEKYIEVEQLTTTVQLPQNGNENFFNSNSSGNSFIVYGSDSNNSILVGSGNDTVFGNGGNDTISGGRGDDSLNGGLGDDIVAGNDGFDRIDGGGGRDTLAGGPRNDFYYVSAKSGGGTIINDLGNYQTPEEIVGGGGNDSLVVYVDNITNNKPIIETTLKSGVVGSKREGTSLKIDLNQSGNIDENDLSILYFYNEDGSQGGGYIENIILGEIASDNKVDLELTKVDSPDPVKLGENLTYTLTVFNNSDNEATEVTLTENLPQGVNYISSSIAPADNSNNILTFDLGTLAAKGTQTVKVIVTPNQAGQITNTASVGSKETDSDPDDNTRQQTTNVIDDKVDLELTKVDSPDPVKLGENLTYTLTVFNNSDNEATEVALTENLPQGVNYISSSIAPADNSNNILTFDLGTLAAKGTQTVKVIVTPNQAGQITNTASVGSKETDSDPDDNTRQQTTTVEKPIEVIVENAWGTVQDGSITFKVRLTEPLTDNLILNYFTIDGSANSGGLQNEKIDFNNITARTLTIKAGNLTPEEGDITVSLQDNEGLVTDKQFEFFARNTAYTDWNQLRADVDMVSDKPPEITDLGYRVNKFFNDPSTDFEAVGLTSDENFYLVLSAQNQKVFVNPQPSTAPFLKTLSDDLGGDTSSQAYTKTQQLVSELSASGGSWTFATGTVYDKNRPPILAIRGTEVSGKDIWDDANPNGVGYEQFQANFGSVSTWLKKTSQPETAQNDMPLILRPHITGHSLGGALTQWIAGEYLATTSTSFNLGDVVAFNMPAISNTSTNKIDTSRVDSITLNIMSGDIVSLAGDKYLIGSKVNLFDYNLGILGSGSVFDFSEGNRGIFNTHSIPMYISNSGTLQKPFYDKQASLSSSQASDFFFSYFPDRDYLAFVAAITSVSFPLGAIIGSALIFRGTTERVRKSLGVELSNLLELLKTAQSAWQSGVDAFNSAINYTNAAWKTLKDQALSLLQISESSTENIVPSSTGSGFVDLNSAIPLAHNQLTQFANSANFDSDMVTIFGGELDAQVVNNLRQQWLAGDFSKLPIIQIVPSAQIGGKNGAFTALGEIYIADTFLSQNLNNVDAVVSVLIEEIGHWVDTQVNQFDASGDEGEIFASLAQGITLAPQQLDTLRNENDFVALSLEQPDSFEENVIDNFWKAIRFFSPEAWQALGSYPDEAWIAMRSWGETGWSAVSQWTAENWNASKKLTPSQWQATEQFTKDNWDNLFQQPSNTSPIAQEDKTLTVFEDAVPKALGITKPTDVDGDSLTLIVNTTPNTAIGEIRLSSGTAVTTLTSLTLDHLSSLVFVPMANANGAAGTFSYTVSDGKGGTASQTITLDITPVNDAPTGTPSATLPTGTEDTAYSINSSDLLQGFTDVDGDTLSISGLTASNGTFSDNGNGTYTYTPNANYNGAVPLSYNVVDGNGGIVAATQSFTLEPVNDPPTGTPSATLPTGTEDTVYIINVADLLTGFSDVDGDTLTVSGLTATNGTLANNGNSTYTFTPNANYNGTINLLYNVNDGNGGSAAASQSFNLFAVNDLPLATNDTVQTNQNSAVAINLIANDSDIDGTLDPSTVSISSNPTHGTVSVNTLTGAATYTPATDYFGTDSFAYTVKDNEGGISNAAIVSITVNSTTNIIQGTKCADTLLGTNLADTIDGKAGNDTITGKKGNDTLIGGGNRDKFIFGLGDGTDTITDFGGVGTGSKPTPAIRAEVDTLKFQGTGLTARNLLLTQNGNDLEIAFEGITDNKVILKNFDLQNLDNLPASCSGPAIGNILFNKQTYITDSYDVFDTNATQTNLFNRNTVTFLNELDNTVSGFENSDDVINGQGGNDIINGKSGNDLLRGGAGNDTLLGGNGDDILRGGTGNDYLTGGNGKDLFVLALGEGTDTIFDFKRNADKIGLADGLSFGQLTITQGIGSNANNTLIADSSNNELLAILSGVQANTLTSIMFTSF